MNSPSHSASAGAQVRQKRVLPSRSRRGGPGVGSCDVDLMILDTQKRKSENEPLIPAQTKFLLTTNATLVPSAVQSSSTAAESGLNPRANERYFDRPEVLKTYKEQQIIQTPEFINLADDASVGGRFRPRGSEDEAADTSDAAYEKRHRKYETFEKRQRLREKEKLKHEHYKLKERIEQLRAMDSAAFLALPSSSFSVPPRRLADDPDAREATNFPSAHVNGAASHNEGERRRKEMLDVASTLEERYRVLLPPDRMKKGGRPGSINTSVDLEVEGTGKESRRRSDEDESEVEEEDSGTDVAKQEVEKIKLKIKFPVRRNSSRSHSSTFISSSRSSKKQKTSFPPPLTKKLLKRATRATHTVSSVVSKSFPRPDSHLDPTTPNETPSTSASPVPNWVSVHETSISNPKIAVLETESPAAFVPYEELTDTGRLVADTPRSLWDTRPHEHIKSTLHSPVQGSAVPLTESLSVQVNHSASCAIVTHPTLSKQHVSSAGAAGQAERTNGVLMISALRNSSAPKARKTQRHLMAFGMKVPPEVEEMRDFELPSWLQDDPIFEDCLDNARMNGVGEGMSLVDTTSPILPNATVEPSKHGTNSSDPVGDVPQLSF